MIVARLTVLTTLLHYLAIPCIRNVNLPHRAEYMCFIYLSTTVSVAWHMGGEMYNWIMAIDYLLAILWTLFDFILSGPYFWTVFCLNTGILFLNAGVELISQGDYQSYEFYHSVWHVLSALKAMYIANLIT